MQIGILYSPIPYNSLACKIMRGCRFALYIPFSQFTFEPAVILGMQLLLFSIQYAGHYKIAGSEPPHLTCHHLFMSKKVAKDISSKPKEDK